MPNPGIMFFFFFLGGGGGWGGVGGCWFYVGFRVQLATRDVCDSSPSVVSALGLTGVSQCSNPNAAVS